MNQKKTGIKWVKLAALLAALLTAGACAAGQGDAGSPSAPSAAQEEGRAVSESGNVEKTPALGDFSVADLEGGDVDQTVFENSDLTMVNVWGTFCGPCVEEMPWLGEISREYADKGVQILGVVVDTLDQYGNPVQEQLDTAREIVEKTGASYTHLIPDSDLLGKPRMMEAVYIPTTFFADRQGNTVGPLLSGKMSKDEYVKIIEELLAEIRG